MLEKSSSNHFVDSAIGILPIKYLDLVARYTQLLLEEVGVLESPLVDSLDEWTGIFVLENLKVRAVFELILGEEKVEDQLRVHPLDFFLKGGWLGRSYVLLELFEGSLVALFLALETSFHFEELFGGDLSLLLGSQVSCLCALKIFHGYKRIIIGEDDFIS